MRAVFIPGRPHCLLHPGEEITREAFAPERLVQGEVGHLDDLVLAVNLRRGSRGGIGRLPPAFCIKELRCEIPVLPAPEESRNPRLDDVAPSRASASVEEGEISAGG